MSWIRIKDVRINLENIAEYGKYGKKSALFFDTRTGDTDTTTMIEFDTIEETKAALAKVDNAINFKASII